MKKGLIVAIILVVTLLAAGCTDVPSSVSTPTPESTATPTTAASTTEPVPTTIPASTQTTTAGEGSLRLLISDEENAINDFEELWVHITSIGVHSVNDSDNWIEPEDFEPVEVNLKELIAENATEIWSGFLEAGVYNKVFIHVDNVTAVPDAEIQLPSGKLQISKQFEVADGEVTNFVYDVTIFEAGESGKYILKPQIADSGANQEFQEVESEGQTKRYKEKNEEQNEEQSEEQNEEQNGEDEGELQLQLIGELGLGMEVTLIVADEEGSPVEGATVTVNEVELEEKTGVDGSVIILLPDTPGEVEIEAILGDKEGELEFELEE